MIQSKEKKIKKGQKETGAIQFSQLA